MDSVGLNKIKTALLFYIIGAVVAFTAGFLGLSIFSVFFFFNTIGGFIREMIAVILLLIVIVIYIIGLIYMWDGFSKIEPEFENAGIGKIGLILTLIPFLNIIGFILLGITFYLLGEKLNSSMMKVGGILTIIPVINFVGIIILYVAFGDIITK
ncbi:hypothetical protein MJ1_0260 [Nanobdella aerobiophila]|uniref:Uncharacterized protein n=1 Tax=Nanobdella aerobiophila TaxID=2586965 RepID=A0A915WS19_9ARCH|nr:DUF973 family protein [Nanobdella aerobiophila]BBL45431.1 hypothetical protein MJ1_0260 [Nanobdella aerobiophila]